MLITQKSLVQSPPGATAIAQLVERTAFNRVVEGSSPSGGIRDVAQRLAREAHNLEVLGSIPSIAPIPCGPMVTISGFHPEDPGSILGTEIS